MVRGSLVSRRVGTLAEYVDVVSEAVERWSGEDWYPTLWFRGHRNSDWRLEAKWRRAADTLDDGAAWVSEERLHRSIIARAEHLMVPIPRTPWEWVYALQHYGAPTRLLDWTESSLIGLYFAIADWRAERRRPETPVVWMLEPHWLLSPGNLASAPRIPTPPFDELTYQSSDVALLAALKQLFGDDVERERDLPCPIQPPELTPRIRAQLGRFVLFPDGPAPPLDEVAARLEDPRLMLVEVEPDEGVVERMKQQLGEAGITRAALFPELEVLCSVQTSYLFPGFAES